MTRVKACSPSPQWPGLFLLTLAAARPARSHFEADKSVFDLNEGKHHDHLVCIRCGRVEEFYDAEIERRQKEVARERGFELQDHAHTLYGICSKPRVSQRELNPT
jgi:Fur family ferric uptake transcriptional regulator